MMQSDQINELATALAKAQGQIQAASKDATNPYFKSSYASLASVWDACREALFKNGLSVTQTTAEIENGTILVTTLMHGSGQWVSSEMMLRAKANDAQGIGSALTYARRYSLAAIVGVAPDDDDDGNAAGKPIKKQEEAPRQQPAKAKEQPATNGKLAPTNPNDLLALVDSRVEVTYNTVPHLLNAIRKQLDYKAWNWPKADDVEGWRQAYAAAKTYAESKTQPAPEQETFLAQDSGPGAAYTEMD